MIKIATLECKLALLRFIEQPRKLRGVFTGQPQVQDSTLDFSHLQGTALGIAKSRGIELCAMRCLNHQNVESRKCTELVCRLAAVLYRPTIV